MEHTPVRPDLGPLQKPVVQLARHLFFRSLSELGDMEDELIEFHRIVVKLPDLQLPGTDIGRVIQDMLELIEIDQGAFDLVELHRLDFGIARHLPEQPRHDPSEMGAWTVNQAAVDDVSGPITQDNTAAGFERG